MSIHLYRYPVRFYILSAAVPWAFWAVAAYFSRQENAADYGFAVSVFGLLGLCGPIFVAAYYFMQDKDLLDDLKSRIFNFNASNKVYLIITLLIMPVSILLAMAISLLFGYSADQFTFAGQLSFSSGLFPAWFFLLLAPALEELAWHSYGTDCLRQRFNLFYTSIIFAFYWVIWHVPLAFIEGYYHNNLVLEGLIYNLNFTISLFVLVFLMNWLYYKTGRNILVPIVIHAAANTFNEIFSTHPDSKVIQTGLLLVVCVIVLAKEKDMFFKLDEPVH